jgi:ABC-2 type transport system permease protein
VTNVAIMGSRCIRLASRNIDALLEALILPVMVMLVFVYLFGGAIKVSGSYVDYVVPGVLVLCASFGSAFTAVSVNHDVTGQIMDRFRSLDVSGAAVLGGHVIASLVRNGLSIIIVFGVALAIGFRPSTNVVTALIALGVLLLFVVAFSWVGAVVGVLLRSPEAATGFTFVAFFLVNPSSALVPIRTMPAWIRGFARNQPLSSVVDATRGLLLHARVDRSLWIALAWCVGGCLVAILLSGIALQQRTR